MINKAMKYLYSFAFPALLSIPLSTVSLWIEKYIFSDWEFLKYLTIMVVIDTALAMIYACKKKKLSSKGYWLIGKKIFSYAVLLIIANAARNIDTSVQLDHGGLWVSSLICWSLFMREGLSILEKLSKLNIDIVPEKIMRYFKDYNNNENDK